MQTAQVVFFIITAIMGSGLGIHALVQAYKYGQLVQRVNQLEEERDSGPIVERVKRLEGDHVRTRELTDRLFDRLDEFAQSLARIEAHLPKRSNDK